MKNLMLFLFAVVLLAACSNEHEPVALKKSGNVQVSTSFNVSNSKKDNSPTSRGLTLDGFVAVWSSSTEQTVALPESTPTERVAIDNPIPPP